MGKEYEMKVNAKKTKVITITNKKPTKCKITVDENIIQQVTNFVYLGQLLHPFSVMRHNQCYHMTE